MLKRKFSILLLVLGTSLLSSCQETTPILSGDISIFISNLEKYELKIGESLTLEVNVFGTTNKGVTYSSSDPSIIEVHQDGSIIGLKEGRANITITSNEDSSISQTYQFKVLPLPVVIDDSITYEVLNTRNGSDGLSSIGNSNVLVLPIVIEDFEASATQSNLERINQAFNGPDVTWESVSSFYKASSYDKLNLEFTVPDKWFECGYNPKEMQSYNDGIYGISRIIKDGLNWYKTNYNSDLTEFDKDKDGNIDSLWMIYSSPNYNNDNGAYNRYSGIDTSAYWAFVGSLMTKPNIDFPVANRIGWASYDFMDNLKKSGTTDTHTYIHETGHMLGLNDYYNYDVGSSYRSNETPLGGLDMMDFNIGDHNAFSKFALGRIKPKIVKETTKISLKPFESSGDAIILTNENYNGTPFDEYFIISYITPTGVNKYDAENLYPSFNLNYYTENGVQIIHVDSRAIDSNGKFTSNKDDFYDVGLSNTPSRNISYQSAEARNSSFQLTLMQNNSESSQFNVLSKEYPYSYSIMSNNGGSPETINRALFHEGDSFNLGGDSQFNNFMASGSNLLNKYYDSKDAKDIFNFDVSIGSMNDSSVKININLK